MIRKHFALTLLILSACAEKKAEPPTPALTSAKEELKAAENANTEKLQAAAQAMQELAQDKAKNTTEVAKLKTELADELKDKKPDQKVVQELKADIEKKAEEIAEIDQKGAEKQHEIAALEQERADIEAQKAELAQEEKEAEKIADAKDNSNWPQAITIMHQALPEAKKLPTEKNLLSAPVLFPEMKTSFRYGYTKVLKQDADTMVIVSVQDGGIKVVKIKATASAGSEADQSITQIPLDLENNSTQESTLRAARVTSRKGLDVLLLSRDEGYKLELVRLDDSLKLVERRTLDSSGSDYNLGEGALFLNDDTLVWGQGKRIARANLATKAHANCGLKSLRIRGGDIGGAANAVYFRETETPGEYLALFLFRDFMFRHMSQAATITFDAPSNGQNGLCGIQVQDETTSKSFGYSDISARSGYAYFSGDFQGGYSGFGQIYTTMVSGDEAFKASERLYQRVFKSSNSLLAISATRDESQIDFIQGDLQPHHSFKHSARISDALPVEANGARVLVIDKEGTILLFDSTRTWDDGEEAVLDSRKILDENKTTEISKLRFGQDNDIVPLLIGAGFSNADFNRVGFIKVSK